VALAVGDAIAIVASHELNASVSSVFSRNHPGGAIGATLRKPQRLKDIAIPVCDIPLSSPRPDMRGGDVLKAGYDSSTGWVRVGDMIVSPSRIRRLDGQDLARPLDEIPWIGAAREDWITISADSRISQAAEWIHDMRSSPDESCEEQSILAVVDDGNIVGVLEVGQLLNWRDESD
jgi:hypothetical protein